MRFFDLREAYFDLCCVLREGGSRLPSRCGYPEKWNCREAQTVHTLFEEAYTGAIWPVFLLH